MTLFKVASVPPVPARVKVTIPMPTASMLLGNEHTMYLTLEEVKLLHRQLANVIGEMEKQ